MTTCKTFSESFEKMFDPKIVDPEEVERLKQLTLNQPGAVERYFDVMTRYAPSLALDPVVAATWVRAVANQRQVGPADIRSLVQTQREIWEMVGASVEYSVDLRTYGKES